MRLGKVCGFLMKAFLAVLMLFVTAAAMEMEVYDEDDLAYAIDEKCENIIWCRQDLCANLFADSG